MVMATSFLSVTVDQAEFAAGFCAPPSVFQTCPTGLDANRSQKAFFVGAQIAATSVAVFDPRQKAEPPCPYVQPSARRRNLMRIFERLRARGSRGASVERRLFEAIIADLASKLDEPKLDEPMTPPVVSESKLAWFSGRSTDDKPH
jgi:hypothetical protein